MPVITFDKWDSGLDVRKAPDTSDADRLRVLYNAFVTTGKEIQKRPGARLFATLEPGSAGLEAADDELKTFTTDHTLTHAHTLISPVFVPHPTTPAATVARIHFSDVFQGFIYVAVEYDNEDLYHHYLDAGSADSPAWEGATAYTVGDYVTPPTPNGFRYECTDGGTSGGSQPTWPTEVGQTVADNDVEWTARSFVITDPNCPHTKSVTKQRQKIYAIDGDVTRFCATANARDWSSAEDAGFIPTGLQQSGAADAMAVADYQDKLVVFFPDSAQIWLTDPDPQFIVLDQRIFHVGTRYPKSPLTVSDDIFFLSDPGFRSITLSQLTENFQDSDVGSPIDPLVKPTLTPGIDPRSVFYPAQGQFWNILDRHVWTYTFSRTAKLAAWAEYEFPFSIEAETQLSGELYLRSGDNIYVVDENYFTDDGELIPVAVELPYLNFKQPGILKQITGADVIVEGTALFSVGYDPNDPDLATPPMVIGGNTQPGGLVPVELLAVQISPKITHEADERFRLSALIFHFENLGPM